MQPQRNRHGTLALAAALLLTASPAVAPDAANAQGSQALAGLSARDRQVGAEGYKQLLQEFGGAVDGPLSAYVAKVGTRVAMASVPGSRATDWHVTVLNSPVPNAMATPGGYLYITRGLLAMINSEAELAAVLGHEAGHVAARHSDKRSSRATIGALGSIAAAILLGGQAASLVNNGAGALIAGYSRGQENEADTLGMRYAIAAGYDPRAAASMLAALDRVGAVEGRQTYEDRGLGSIFSTHPVTADRVQRVAAQAARTGRTGATNRAAFLAAVDGMTFGDAPDQGVISGPSFRHAALRLGFDAPPGFTLQNSPGAVTGKGRDGSRFQFTGVALQPGQTLRDVLQQAWQNIAGGVPRAGFTERRIDQFDAATSQARLSASNGQQLDVGLSVFRAGPSEAWLVQTMAPAGKGAQFDQMIASFRRLTPSEIEAASRGRHIRIVAVGPADTAQSLAARMSAPYNRVQSFLALNGITGGAVTPGERLKIIAN